MYNALTDITEVVNYLQQAAGFTYLQSPGSWQSAFESLHESAKMLNLVSGEASAEITNIASAYTAVGKDIYATAESGLKNAPVIESVFTQADQETAVIGESALGTYVAGLSIAVPASVAIAGVLGGLGIGILGYETAPEGWVDISNAIFDTDISYGEAQPLIRSYIQGMLALNSNGDPQVYLDEGVLNRAYAYFAQHIFGGIDYSFLENTVWEPTSVGSRTERCTAATQQYLANHNFDMAATLSDQFLQNIYYIWVAGGNSVGIEDMPAITVSFADIINNLYSLYPNYHNANLFKVSFRYMATYGAVNYYQMVIDGYSVSSEAFYGVTVGQDRELVYNMAVSDPHTDADYNYRVEPVSTPTMIFSYKYTFEDNIGVVRDDGVSYDNVYNPYSIGARGGASYQHGGVDQNYCSMWNIGASDSIFPGMDEELTNKGFIIDPKLANGVDPDTAAATKPKRNTNFQDQYAYWYGGKKRVAQPDLAGEPQITTYLPTPIPMYIPDAATQVITEGVGVPNNPNSIPLDIPAALPVPYPAALPANTPATNIEDSQKRAVDAFNDSRTVPGSAPDPLPEYDPNPQYPENPPKNENGDSGTTPVPGDLPGVTASGLVSVYNPTKAQLVSFSGWLWSNNFLDNFLKIFQNPMDAIIGLHVIYATPTAGSTGNIIAGYLDSGVSSKIVTKQYSEIDCGSVDVPEYFGNALDYEPYVQIHCYLPFIGIVSLKPNDILGKKLNIKYGVDFLTGACLAMLTTSKGPQNGGSKILTYTYAGNCATQIPISGGSYAQMITGLAGVAVSAAAGIASGNPIALLGAGASILNTHLDVQHSGSIGANAGAMGPRKPYIIITRKSAYEAGNYNEFYGYPANKTVTLGSCSGYTRVKSVHIDSIGIATDAEKIEIESLLKQGVIIK